MTRSRASSANKHSDEGLVAATKRGDAQAFEELVFCHRQKVVPVALRIRITGRMLKMWRRRVFAKPSIISTRFKRRRGSLHG